jgi:hypothetical protein
MMGNWVPKRTFQRYTEQTHRHKVSPRRITWSFSISAMHLVCKKANREYTTFLYSRTEFRFSSPNWLHHFCINASKTGMPYVRKVQLNITTYGQPGKMRDVRFVDMHYAAWDKAIRAMIKAMPHVEQLAINLRVTDTPLIFTFHEPWAAIVLQLRELRQLEHAPVTLWSPACKKHYSWDDPTQEVHSPEWMAIAGGFHFRFALAIGLRLEGRDERTAVEAYRASVNRALRAKQATLLRHLMGHMWLQQAKNWDWLA